MKQYLVGGAVRDQLLGLPIQEKDWVIVGGNAEALIAKGYRPVGKDFPVFLHPETHDEYALARTERKISVGYKGFEFYTAKEVTLEQDLLRRDLTINAMAQDEQGKIIDPYQGQLDLKNRVLRHVSPAFVEDPVRILRVARFCAQLSSFQFSIAPETMQLMRQMVKQGEVNALVKERVWQEFHKALQSPAPEKFILALRQCGALSILFPELHALFGVPNKKIHHPEIDSGIHTLMVLQQACLLSDDPKVRFSAMVHDFGKALTDKSQWPSHKGHEAEGLQTIKQFCQRLHVPKSFTQLALLVGEFHGLVSQALDLRANTLLKLLNKTDAFRQPQRFQALLLAAEADSRGRPGFEKQPYPQRPFLTAIQQAAAQVNIQSLVEAGYQGPDLVERIQTARLAAIKNHISHQP